MCIYVYMYMYIYMCIYVYMYRRLPPNLLRNACKPRLRLSATWMDGARAQVPGVTLWVCCGYNMCDMTKPYVWCDCCICVT